MNMIKVISQWLIAITLVTLSVVANAQTVPGYNEAQVPVADQSQNAFRAALPQALNQVLIKISGNPGVNTLPSIQDQANNASAWVKSYSYNTTKEANGNTQLMLHVQFDIKSIYQLLSQADQSAWSDNRPLTLVWLEVQTPSGWKLITNDQTNATAIALKNTTWQRGLPIILPMMDLQDQAILTSQLGKPLTDDQLKTLTKQYGVNNVLVGQLTAGTDQSAQGQWQLTLNGEPYQWQSQANNDDQLMKTVMNETANLMANRLAIITPDQTEATVMIQVNGVGDLADYAKVMQYLTKLTPVSGVSVANINPHGVLLKVETIGGQSGLAQAINVGQKLVATPQPTSEHNLANLYYRWHGAQ